MKKYLLLVFIGLSFLNMANADGVLIPNQEPDAINPICKVAFDHIHLTHKSLQMAIKANDANTVGTIIIANHKYMQNFLKKHPECKPLRHTIPLQAFN